MNRRLTLACAALLALGACKDGGTPTVPKEKADLIVHLSAAASAAAVVGPGGEQLLSCTFTIQALATGDMAARAEWKSGKVDYFSGFDTEPVSTMWLSGSQLTDVFGGPFSPLLDGAALLNVVSATPFSMVMEVSYRVQNTNAHRVATSARSTCALPSGNLSAAPTPAALEVAPASRADDGGRTWSATLNRSR